MQTGAIQRKPKAVRLSPEIQGKIGQQLRAMYDDLVKEGVPDRLTDLLRQLDQQVAQHAHNVPDGGGGPPDGDHGLPLETQKDREPG